MSLEKRGSGQGVLTEFEGFVDGVDPGKEETFWVSFGTFSIHATPAGVLPRSHVFSVPLIRTDR